MDKERRKELIKLGDFSVLEDLGKDLEREGDLEEKRQGIIDLWKEDRKRREEEFIEIERRHKEEMRKGKEYMLRFLMTQYKEVKLRIAYQKWGGFFYRCTPHYLHGTGGWRYYVQGGVYEVDENINNLKGYITSYRIEGGELVIKVEIKMREKLTEYTEIDFKTYLSILRYTYGLEV